MKVEFIPRDQMPDVGRRGNMKSKERVQVEQAIENLTPETVLKIKCGSLDEVRRMVSALSVIRREHGINTTTAMRTDRTTHTIYLAMKEQTANG